MDRRVLTDIVQALEHSQKTSAAPQPNVWRIIMKSQITKFAAAAAIIIAAGLLITFLGTSKPAYALPQTIKANHTVRYLHIKDFDMRHEDEPKEFWFECDDFGQIKNARWHMPEWDSPADGAKVVVWKEGKAEVWFKKKKSMGTFAEQKLIDQMSRFVERHDPRKTVEHLDFLQTKGKVKIEIDESSDKSEPIVVTATYLPESRSGRREVLFVDQATKLVMAIEYYQLKDGKYEHQGTMEFCGYNQPIEAEMFSLDNEVPADVMRVDYTTQEVGMAQGKLSDEEIAVEVAHQFFEAMISKDYDKAGKLLAGIPGNRIQQMFGNINFLRVISIGSPAPHPDPRNKGCLIVPSVVEIEKDGEISEWKLDRLGVGQAVHNQPGRWIVFGGIDPKHLEPSIPNDNKLIEEHESPSARL